MIPILVFVNLDSHRVLGHTRGYKFVDSKFSPDRTYWRSISTLFSFRYFWSINDCVLPIIWTKTL